MKSRCMLTIVARRFCCMSAMSVTPSYMCCASTSMASATPTTVTRIETETISSSSENPACRFIAFHCLGIVVTAPRFALPDVLLRVLRDVAGQRVRAGERSRRVGHGDDDHADAILASDIGDDDGALHFVIDGKLDLDVVSGAENAVRARLDNGVRQGRIVVSGIDDAIEAGIHEIFRPVEKNSTAADILNLRVGDRLGVARGEDAFDCFGGFLLSDEIGLR